MVKATDFKYTGTEILFSTENTLSHYNRWIVGMIVKYFVKYNAKTVLDFGAGVGSLATIFREVTGVRPETLEIDRDQREILKQRGFNPFSAIGDLPEGIDFIYTSNVLEHIPADVQALRDLRFKLSPGGHIAIYVPAFRLLWSSLDDKVGHQRRYSKKLLTENLNAAGFTVDHISYRDSVGFGLAILFKLLGNREGQPSERSLLFFDRFLLPISRLIDVLTNPFFGKNVFAIARSRP